MDVNKLLKKVMESEDVKGIPTVFVFTVIKCVIDAISSGECFYDTE